MATVLDSVKRLSAYKGSNSTLKDRRGKPRIYVPFPAKVQGTDASGREFEVDAALDNLNANGMYLRLMYKVKFASNLVVEFRLMSSVSNTMRGPRVKVNGNVIRIDEYPGDVYGVALSFSRPQFL